MPDPMPELVLWYDLKYFDHIRSRRWFTYKAELPSIQAAEDEQRKLFHSKPHFRSRIVRCEVVQDARPVETGPLAKVAAFLADEPTRHTVEHFDRQRGWRDVVNFKATADELAAYAHENNLEIGHDIRLSPETKADFVTIEKDGRAMHIPLRKKP